MITKNRRRFASQAIWYFLRQDYPYREIIIIDDGEDSIADLIPRDSRLRYVRLDHYVPLGTKRNMACELSTGEFIAHWDDDAWYASSCLRIQVAHMEETGAKVGNLHNILYYEPLTGRLWRYMAPANNYTGSPKSSLFYRRSYWQAHPFSDVIRGEEGDFLRAIPSEHLSGLDGSLLTVALVHGGSTVTPNRSDPRWQPCPFHELSRLIDTDLAFYAGLHSENSTYTQQLAPLPITLAATFMVYDGYGSMAEYLALGMARSGADLHILPFRIDPTSISTEFLSLWQKSRPTPDGVVLCHAWWGENLAQFGSARDLFIKTVWETSHLPKDWPARLNHARAVIVPSQFAARVFRESGVTVPVEVAYEGIDPDIYHYQERPERSGLTTLIVGVLAPRKNFRQAIAAWKLAFADDPEARLILKARFQLELFIPDDPRIQIIDSNEPTRGIVHWYQQADVLLALGNEGFGLPLIEGMATGLPVVALNSEAQADICAEAEGLVLPVEPARWEKVEDAPYGACGVRAIPSVEDAARQLRWVAEHRQEAQAMGQAASNWVQEKRNVWQMGPSVLEIMERHMRSARPLRGTWALWAPRCECWFEVGFYAAQLANATKSARLYECMPTHWRAQLLHIQQVPGVLNDGELTHQVQRAQRDGMPVIVTEHAVKDQAEPWEQQADVLIALTVRGIEQLKARWPHKRVEFIPPGSPPWQPSPRTQSGRTVAVIGHFDSAKSLGQVLTALPDLPGTDVLVFGTLPEEEDNATWYQAIQRGQLRCVTLPSSEKKLIKELGQQADLVIFWRDEKPYTSTNYTARLALASGIPVLTSSSSEFADLAGAVFQPKELVAGIEELFTNATLRIDLIHSARTYCEASDWQRVAAQHLALWQTLSLAA